jgi:hypothetical protein
VSLGQAVLVTGHFPEAPTAVASRGTEAGDLRFDDHDPEIRLLSLQVIRGPQPGVACPDDGDIGDDVAGETGTGKEILPDGVVPERKGAVTAQRLLGLVEM